MSLSAERQPGSGPEIRLQAALVRKAAGTCGRPARERRAGRARRRLQCDADRARCIHAGALGRRRAVPARGARSLSPAYWAGVDRCAARAASEGAHLHLPEIFPKRVCPRCRTADRSSAVEPVALPIGWSRPESTVRRGVASMPAITRPPGSRLWRRRARLHPGTIPETECNRAAFRRGLAPTG